MGKLVLAFVVLSLGCTSVETRSREVFRVGPLRGVAVAATAVDPEIGPLAISRTDLSDDELKRAEEELKGALEEEVAKSTTTKRMKGARLAVDRCQLRAVAGRKSTVHTARCRVSLLKGEARLASAEGTVVQTGPAKAITQATADKIAADKKKGLARNPLIKFEETVRALRAAVAAGIERLAKGRTRRTTDRTLRRSALKRLDDERSDVRASAAIDLGQYGKSEDGIKLVPLLSHERPIVRRAAASALADLAPASARAAIVGALASEKEDAVVRPLQRAKRRIDALAN